MVILLLLLGRLEVYQEPPEEQVRVLSFVVWRRAETLVQPEAVREEPAANSLSQA